MISSFIQSHRNREGAQTCRSLFFSQSDFFRTAAMPVSPTATAQPAPVTTQDTIPASASTLSLENSKILLKKCMDIQAALDTEQVNHDHILSLAKEGIPHHDVVHADGFHVDPECTCAFPVLAANFPVQMETFCHACGSLETPEWRRGPLGPRTLCNACGLIYAKLRKKDDTQAAESLQELTRGRSLSEVTNDNARSLTSLMDAASTEASSDNGREQ